MQIVAAGVHVLDGRLSSLLSGRAHRDGVWFAFETPQQNHDANTGFATEGRSLTSQEFGEECDMKLLLMACGRCLRPALYSSLRSSPSHPAGVSALRVTIAIANARFARKSPRLPAACWLGSWGLGTSGRRRQDKSRRVRPVGRLGNRRNFKRASNIAKVWHTLPICRCCYVCWPFGTLWKAL